MQRKYKIKQTTLHPIKFMKIILNIFLHRKGSGKHNTQFPAVIEVRHPEYNQTTFTLLLISARNITE